MRAQLWPQVFGHVITALVMFQLFMIGILAVKQSYTSSVVVPLLFITAIFTMVCRSIFERPFQVMSLRGAVDLDKHEEVRCLSCGDGQRQHGSLASALLIILGTGGLSPAYTMRRTAAGSLIFPTCCLLTAEKPLAQYHSRALKLKGGDCPHRCG